MKTFSPRARSRVKFRAISTIPQDPWGRYVTAYDDWLLGGYGIFASNEIEGEWETSAPPVSMTLGCECNRANKRQPHPTPEITSTEIHRCTIARNLITENNRRSALSAAHPRASALKHSPRSS